jgi:hypothetical protein
MANGSGDLDDASLPDVPEERLAWIFGSSRSGSTWLLRMLADLPHAVGVDDPHIGHHLGVWRPIPLAWAAADAEPELTTLDQVKREKPGYFFADRFAEVWRPKLRELIEARFAAQAAGEGESEPLVFVKEPGSQAAELLLSLFPRSRLIFLLRDGRDVVDSWVAAYQDGSWAQQEGAFPLAEDGREAFVRWQASVWAYRTHLVHAAFRAHDPARRVLVRYEDLLAHTASELRRICDAVGIAPDDAALQAIADKHDFNRVPRFRKGERFEARSATPGGWRESLTRAERRAVHEVAGEALVESGYITPAELAAELGTRAAA